MINNAIVFERTHEDSLTDPLTGLPNTRFMVTHLNARARPRRASQRRSVAARARPGRLQGDQRHARPSRRRPRASRCRTGAAHGIRPYDICVRYAGDEFIVVLAGCGFDEAETKRKELQEAVERRGVRGAARRRRVPLSISAGSAVFPHDGDSYESLLAKADSRMYRDKVARKSDDTRRPCVRRRSRQPTRRPKLARSSEAGPSTFRSRGIRRPRAALRP